MSLLKAKTGSKRDDTDAKRARRAAVGKETKQVHAHLPKHLHAKLFTKARANGVNVSDLIRGWAEKYTN